MLILGTWSQGVGPPYSWRKIRENKRKSSKHHLVTIIVFLLFCVWIIIGKAAQRHLVAGIVTVFFNKFGQTNGSGKISEVDILANLSQFDID